MFVSVYQAISLPGHMARSFMPVYYYAIISFRRDYHDDR